MTTVAVPTKPVHPARRLARALAAAALLLAPTRSARPGEYEVVVYGGTSAAVAAAVEASRMGRSVVIVSPDHHLGGLTSNGLGLTDVGARDTIGGLSREFYTRVYEHYLDESAWDCETRGEYVKRATLDPDAPRRMMFTFEPKVAEQIFNDLVAEHDVPVVSGRLDRVRGVAMSGKKITSIRTEAGAEFSGAAYIDATYEGDLMAAAGVTYAIGREPNDQYGETLNGIQTAHAVKNQLPSGIDPYVEPGDPTSGLLPGVNAAPGGPDGAGDQRLQAYNYRMVLTNDPENRMPVARPSGYDEANYEVLFRAIEAGQTGHFFKPSPMPNHKTDSNNEGGVSTDLIGGNYVVATGVNYAEAHYETREQMERAHRDYQMGLVWTLQNHPRVPAAIRNAWDDWGLPLDEFADNGHWPHQIYVREARRMVGELVINENHVNQREGYEQRDSVGMGGYNMDSHNAQRFVNDAGHVWNEGDVQVAPAKGPYPISYRAIVPRRGEAENLLVPVAVSASHIAYGSIRMEPVFMTLGQSAGAAAALMVEHEVTTHELPYPLLRSRLIQGGQVLGPGYVSPDAGILLNFGAAVADNSNSPGHELGGAPASGYNLVTGDTPAGIKDARGVATSVSIDLGKSAPRGQSIDWRAQGYRVLPAGTHHNSGVYGGNAASALFVDDGKESGVDLGVRVAGLTGGTYDVYLTAKNTNTSVKEQYNVYTSIVAGHSGATDYSTAAPETITHEFNSHWRHGDTFLARTFTIADGEDLVVVVEGVTEGEVRGFINMLEIVELAGRPPADLNGPGENPPSG